MLCWSLIVGGLLIMMGQHDRSAWWKAHPPAKSAGRACPEQAKRAEGVGQPYFGNHRKGGPAA